VSEALPSIAIISTMVPPAPTGQARVLGHLVGDPPPPNIVLLTEHWPGPPATRGEARFANYREFKQRRLRLRETGSLERLVPRLNTLAGVASSTFERAREIKRAAAEYSAAAIIACTGSPFDLPASAIAALASRRPLIVYLFDDPVFQWAPGPLRSLARLWEPIWNRIATEVIAPNEAMAEAFFARRRRRPVVIRNPVAAAAFAKAGEPWPTNQGQYRIVYTGSVYHAQSDAFLNLIGALEELPDWSLHIYTSQTDEQLAGYGIVGPQVFRHPHVEQDESYAQQRAADVLFLPLAFHSTIQEVLRTSAPGKLAEYLASGRPILVHAPAETFIARHFRTHRAGVVVDTPDPQRLAGALRDIASDAALREALCTSALALAELYRVEHARDAFWNVVKAAVRRP
jgi:glycosyltransferase involved in cell wall biosynthesis